MGQARGRWASSARAAGWTLGCARGARVWAHGYAALFWPFGYARAELSGRWVERGENAFKFELVKLLLRVAWADGRVVHTEAALIRDMIERLGLPLASRTEVEDWLRREHPAPEPDLACLRQNRRAVLAAARTMVLADDRVSPEEEALLVALERALV